jgi:hypothetical protein
LEEAENLVEAVAGRVVAHLRDARRAATDAYFRAGDEVHTLRAAAACGPAAVRLLAERLSMDESGLQKWARMAEAIRGEERVAICSMVDAAGLPLMPSLLVELVRIRRADDRQRLAREALDRGFSVEQLRARIKDFKRRCSPNRQVR